MQRDSATSPAMGNILMLVITIILAAILAALIFFLPPIQYSFAPIPAIFVITNVIHVDDYTGKLNYDSRVIILHTGTANYQNKNLKAQFYKNGVQVNANIQTLNGDDFINSTVHTGVQWMGGMGCKGEMWTPGEMTAIDLTDGTFRPGDSVQLDIIDSTTNQIISRHTYRVK